jgi:urease accessory protein
LLQWTDSAFPSGGYAHSLGFEELTRLRHRDGEAGLCAVIAEHFVPALRDMELPYARFAYHASWQELPEIDAELCALKLPAELREASTRMGWHRLRTHLRIAGLDEASRLAEAVESGVLSGNSAIIFSRIAKALGVPMRSVLEGLYFQGVSAVCMAALKLLRLGPDACQRALHAALRDSRMVVDASLLIPRDRAGTFDPWLDIAAMRHAFAEERLFIS